MQSTILIQVIIVIVVFFTKLVKKVLIQREMFFRKFCSIFDK